MKTTKAKRAAAAFARSLAKPGRPKYELCLYVAGMMPRSTHAIGNVKEICEEYLKGRYDLRVIDLYQQPMLVEGEQIIAVPTLIKKLPPPSRRITGDLSNHEQVLIGLDLKPKK
jgi:circadian clock protein KaiB